jgi:signal transduction histidine kinase
VDRALGQFQRHARAQARLIDDLLDVSRIITGNLRLNIRPIDLVSVVEAARDGLLPTAEAKHIILLTEFAESRGPGEGSTFHSGFAAGRRAADPVPQSIGDSRLKGTRN